MAHTFFLLKGRLKNKIRFWLCRSCAFRRPQTLSANRLPKTPVADKVGCVAPKRRTRSPPPDQSVPFFKTQTACVACATHPT
ncbi:hypothetical protein [Neisseria bacilliformis]|uniref:hypothetical protein n=1 Tax=Neisseria bacilliformis TaxID=267212 RepID=UPI0028E21D2B|nr:hypothetical protein [Neisseria bacilliformis]